MSRDRWCCSDHDTNPSRHTTPTMETAPNSSHCNEKSRACRAHPFRRIQLCLVSISGRKRRTQNQPTDLRRIIVNEYTSKTHLFCEISFLTLFVPGEPKLMARGASVCAANWASFHKDARNRRHPSAIRRTEYRWRKTFVIVLEITHHALEAVERSFLRRHAWRIFSTMYGRRQREDCLTAASRSGAADVLIEPEAAADDR